MAPEDRRRASGPNSAKRGRKAVSAEDDEEQALLATCRRYLAHPEHPDMTALGEGMRVFVLALMRLAIARVRPKGASAKQVVKLIDAYYVPGATWDLIYKKVAVLTHKSPEAVRKAHERVRPGVFK